MAEQLKMGDVAPGFVLPAADGSLLSLEDLSGSKVILYFYPKAESPGCTREACDFRDSSVALRAAGYQVIGISADPVDDIRAFAAHHGLPFPLLSDETGTVSKSYGAWGEKEVDGSLRTGVLRSTFVIDEAGMVLSAEYRVPAEGHVAALQKQLGIGS